MEKTTDLFTFTFCRSDWERILGALRVSALSNLQEANRIGPDSTYGAVLVSESQYCQAIADTIDFKLPENV